VTDDTNGDRGEKGQTPRNNAGAKAVAVAWSLGWPITAGVIAGGWIDEKLGTSPWGILGLGLGAFVGAVRRIIVLSSMASQS
jgi:F0F1-type ATP synthase assembly protein I